MNAPLPASYTLTSLLQIQFTLSETVRTRRRGRRTRSSQNPLKLTISVTEWTPEMGDVTSSYTLPIQEKR